MRHARRIARLALLLVAIVTLVASSAFAGGPIGACKPGEPFRWPNGGTNIPWNPDLGDLGPLTNAEAVGLVSFAFNQWKSPSTSISFTQGMPLPADVTVANFVPYFFPSAPDGLSAIVFDDSGEIFELLFGPDSGILGFAGPEWVNEVTCDVVEGVSFLNGASFGNVQEALDVMVHEFGHYSGLGHSIVNGQIVIGDTTGPTPFDTFPVTTLVNLIETMYPFYFGPASGFSTPHKDDIQALATLYPAPTFFGSTGSISGRILSSNGRTPKPGLNVIARNVANPFADAVSGISGAFTTDLSPDSPLAGVYILNGLTPGARYAVFVDEILEGEFSVPPGVAAGPEEFYNGRNESSRRRDMPEEFTAVRVRAGHLTDDIDIIFNGFEAGEPLPLRDENSIELALPFTFSMCGTRYHEVFVNSNGTLSFGGPVVDFSESVPEFLGGRPQIAGLWDDFDAGAGGEIFFTEDHSGITVHFNAVPEYNGTTTGFGANTFSITLKRFLDQITIVYGDMSAADGLAGVSCGGAIASGFETPVDLSSLADNFRINLLFQPAVYERFLPESPNDLANLTLRFTPTTDYSDFWAEPNNSLARAQKISLPFSSIPVKRFTEIGRAGDVDFYRFDAKAGETLTAAILSGQLDTVMALYNRRTGERLAFDDDSGPGALSQIVFTIAADGEYALAISTYPDQDFEGMGTQTGRYVLNVMTAAPAAATSSER